MEPSPVIPRKSESKGRKKESYLEWWQKRINTLSGFQYESKKLYEETHTAYCVGSWAILKLALLAFYIKVYTSIIKKRFPRAFYLDCFAGPGLNEIEKTDDIVFGSPLLSQRVPDPDRSFDKLILVEQDPTRARALQKLLPNATIIEGNINDSMSAVFAALPEAGTPGLVFVDPQGLEIHWRTIQQILSRWCDVLINYQTTSVARIWGSYRTNPNYEQSLNDFFGSGDWKPCSSEDELLFLYVRNLQRYREYVKTVLVKGPRGFHYHIIIAVRRTKGTQDWISAIDRAKTNIELATFDDAQKFLDIYHKRQRTLGDFSKQEA